MGMGSQISTAFIVDIGLGFRANFFHFKGGINRWRRTVLLEAVQE